MTVKSGTGTSEAKLTARRATLGTHASNPHPSDRERFGLAEVTQCAGKGPYRPPALAGHREFKGGYPAAQAPGEAPVTKLA